MSDLAHHTAIFVRATAGLAEEPGRVRVVNHRQASYFSERSTIDFKSAIVPSIEKQPSVAIRRKRAAASFLQLRLEVGHVVVFVLRKRLRFTEPDARR